MYDGVFSFLFLEICQPFTRTVVTQISVTPHIDCMSPQCSDL